VRRGLEELAGGLLFVGFEGKTAPPSLLARIAAGRVGGVILFARNLGAPGEVAALTAALRAAAPAGQPLLVGVDQEGGRVQRLRAPLAVWPPMQQVAAHGDEALTRQLGRALGEDLASLGFNLDFAPVLDVVSSEGSCRGAAQIGRSGEAAVTKNSVIGDRSFGPDPSLVARHGLALAAGLLEAGVLPCGKHFPGHGGPVADSHETLPVERRPASELRALDLAPFRAAIAARLPLLMSAHVRYPALDAEAPGTLSRAICTDLLRRELGFEGVLVSDDLEMGAITGTLGPGPAALAALRAGVDLLLICHREDRQQAALEAIVQAASTSSADRARLEEAEARVAALRASLPASRAVAPELALERVHASVHAELLAALGIA